MGRQLFAHGDVVEMVVEGWLSIWSLASRPACCKQQAQGGAVEGRTIGGRIADSDPPRAPD
eukprot:4577726-Lingulodinium_polyedra.AAC.1